MKNMDIEKLGQFYLGNEYDPKQKAATATPILYDSKQLTTHAVCVGMTGSGKTGLCISLLEEAAIDGIPVIAIDPKGDLSDLLLTFPKLRGEDFAPWVDPDEAARKGVSKEEYAEKVAETWRKGLEATGQDGGRIERLHEAADLAIYTPGSGAGLPLTVLRSFNAPPKALLNNAEAYRERYASAASGLLALLGVEADPISSREHILLSNILDASWRAGRDLDMSALIHEVQQPPFDKVGVIDLETFYPAKERFGLAMKLNNLLASPGFAAWMEGDALDVGSLLYTKEGKPRLSILSISHLADAERMFFVTILLNEVLGWMRTQPGTSSLRAILYMDEVFGYFPPISKPPSKMPMLTLLKQARAFGLGIVLATQNPMDLDYKGLSNTGTWFLGRLQTKRDKDRVLEGLEGASTAAGHGFDRDAMDKLLSGLGNRIFLMSNVHEDAPVVFQSRWALSYLRGPLTRDQIQSLMEPVKKARAEQGGAKARVPSTPAPRVQESAPEREPVEAPPSPPTSRAESSSGSRPVVPPDVPQFFVPRRMTASVAAGVGGAVRYRPGILGVARLHYADKKTGIDDWETLGLLQLVGDEVPADPWDDAEVHADRVPELDKFPEAGASFAPLPSPLARAKSYGDYTKSLKNYLYRERKLTIWSYPPLKAFSRVGESERDFRLRLSQGSREARDQAIENLRTKYAAKRAKVQADVERARDRLDREQAKASQAKWDAAVSIGGSILGAFLGRKPISKTNVTKVTKAAKDAGKAYETGSGVGSAQDQLDAALTAFTDLEAEFRDEVEHLDATTRPETLALETIELTPKKSDITAEQVVLAWTPWTTGTKGEPRPAY
ncbi:ATP-binding protein [Aquisphaera insulae]|uniref:ATP-binding protein n=1 Tax=Aquisphaera insulae TaxID=2712864 RepID=UPI0013EDEB23|nr:DUF87 domain-containing protein [Aquisphaera insulae]